MPLLERGPLGRLLLSPPNCPETPYFHDGSLSGDVPLKALACSCGSLYSIVSQVPTYMNAVADTAAATTTDTLAAKDTTAAYAGFVSGLICHY